METVEKYPKAIKRTELRVWLCKVNRFFHDPIVDVYSIFNKIQF